MSDISGFKFWEERVPYSLVACVAYSPPGPWIKEEKSPVFGESETMKDLFKQITSIAVHPDLSGYDVKWQY